jgi:pimeloyl-ACP methyl ester carboxylesterase
MAKDLQQFLDAEERVWSSLGVQPKDRRVALPSGAGVRVQEVGDGQPLIFIHGGSVGGTSWAHLAVRLEGVRCILIDRPGCALSDPVPGDPPRSIAEIHTHADGFLPDLLDALELEHAAIAASSYGGFFAVRGAAAAPQRVTKLVEYSWLVGAPSEAAPLTVRIGALPGMQALMTRIPMTRSMVKGALSQFGMGKAIESGAFDDLMLDWVHALMRHTETLANDVRSLPKVFTPIRGQNPDVLHADEVLAKLNMPALFLWGEEDPNGGAAVARQFAPRLPDAELVVIPGAEHAPWLDDMETCVTHTQAFLDQ